MLCHSAIFETVVAKTDGWPQATTVGYANDGTTLYFLCAHPSLSPASAVALDLGEELHRFHNRQVEEIGVREAQRLKIAAEQARALRPRMVAIADPSLYADLKEALAGSGTEVGAGSSAIIEAACRPAEWVMASIVGAAGRPALEGSMA